MSTKKVNKPTKDYLAEIEKAASEKGIRPMFTIMRTLSGHKTYPIDHMVVICYDKDAESHWKRTMSIMAGATVITPELKKKKSRK